MNGISLDVCGGFTFILLYDPSLGFDMSLTTRLENNRNERDRFSGFS
jgi:hypothetical protein